MSSHGVISFTQTQKTHTHTFSVGIKVLAIDFDLTIVNTHTGGRWKDTSIALAEHVRPVFKHLIPLADESGMLISVVTFSRQVSLIRKVLQQSMEGDNEFVKSMPIEGRIPPHYNTVGKQVCVGNATHLSIVV